jgi:hypothetical protein
VEKLMEARMGRAFVCRGKPWLLLDRRGINSDGTILNETCRLIRRSLLIYMRGKATARCVAALYVGQYTLASSPMELKTTVENVREANLVGD